MKAHPHTQADLDAWTRLSLGLSPIDAPTAEDFPGLVSRLFVLTRVGEQDYAFRRVGGQLDTLFGRALSEHTFLSLWAEPDRALAAAALAAAETDRGPAILRARGQSLDGRTIELEFAVAPLFGAPTAPARFLGLCQTIGSDAALGGRPVRRLQITALYPPAPRPQPAIRVVSQR